MRKITQTIVGTTPPLDKNVIWLDSTDNTTPVEKVFINGQWTPMGIDTDDYYTKEEVNNKLDEKLDVIETPVNGNLIAMDSQGQAIDSGKKTTDFIANPASEGQEGEVLSVDSEGNPVWTTVTPTGTADTEMSDTSTNAVQNKVIKSYVDDNCARKDGYYSTLTVGSAENLVGQTVDSEAYLIRPTGGESNEVANGVASVLGMEGNSAVWNQLFNYTTIPSKEATFGVTITNNNNGSYTITIAEGGATGTVASTEVGISSLPHKFLIKGNGVQLRANGSNVTPNAGSGYIYNNSGSSSLTIRIRIGETTPAMTYTTYIQVFDLTLLGIDNLTTVAEIEEWLAEHVGTKPYYAYNAGTILSAQTLGIKTYGQNLLNPTTRQAKLIPYTWVENSTDYSNQYTIKNVPSGATATFTPDATGVAESVTITDDKFDITPYGSGILELSAATADTYVCIRWNGTKDNDVVPYEDHTYDFDVRKVYGKVNGAGEYVQCFPNGMKSARTAKDSLTANKAVVKIGNVDLGDLTWTYNSSKSRFESASLNGIIKGFTINTAPNIICAKYKSYTANTGDTLGGITSFTESSVTYIRVGDNNYTSAASFKTAMTGVMLNYELATPITYTDLVYRDGGIDRPLADVLMNIEVNNWSMEEQLMTPYEDGNPTSIPATISTIYGMDAVEQIDTLNKTCYFAQDVKDNLQALLNCINTNCAETLGGTFSIGDPTQEDSKVFTFTFTENTEPDVEPTNEGE